MKNSIKILAASALFMAGCGNDSSTNSIHHDHGNHMEGTHTHEDGSVHSDHEESDVHQEEFNVKSDSLSQDSVKSEQQDAGSIK